MTKKHFIALADFVRSHETIITGGCALKTFNEEQIKALAEFLGSQNPRFNRERWIAYINGECGKNGGKTQIQRDTEWAINKGFKEARKPVNY